MSVLLDHLKTVHQSLSNSSETSDESIIFKFIKSILDQFKGDSYRSKLGDITITITDDNLSLTDKTGITKNFDKETIIDLYEII